MREKAWRACRSLGRVTGDPFQQTLAVGIQLGLVGIAVLWATWIAHLLFFRGNTLPAWIGFVVVTQNIVGSMLNTHLFNSTQGWIYVVDNPYYAITGADGKFSITDVPPGNYTLVAVQPLTQRRTAGAAVTLACSATAGTPAARYP